MAKKNGQSRDTGNIGHPTLQKTKKMSNMYLTKNLE